MFNVVGSIEDVKTKRVDKKSKGVIIDTSVFWIVKVRIPVEKIDANVLAHWQYRDKVHMAMDEKQLELKLSTPAKSTRSKKTAQAGAAA